MVNNILVLDKFTPRPYQLKIYRALESDGYKKILCLWPRRAGKDICAWNLAIRQCLLKTCLIFYALPTYSQARKTIFDAIAIDGTKFLDFCPKELVESINSSEMKIRFTNGSILQLIGADSYDTSLVGANPYGIILSEAALMDLENVYAFARPILAANNGWILILSTPRGKNALYSLYNAALSIPEWYVSRLTVHQTKHILADVLAKEKEQMDEGLYQQEYECSFERGQQGLIYGAHLDRLKTLGQITSVAWDPGLLTHVVFDIGVADATAILWWQSAGNNTVIRIIDSYSNTGLGLDHYAKIIQDKPYRYGKMFAPHDIQVREWGGGAMTRWEKAKQLGINLVALDQLDVQDGIENVWTHFSKFWIDSTRCTSLIDALENYKREWDPVKQVYRSKPVHNWASNYCFTGETLVLTRNGMRQIMDIQDNDHVATLEGWKPCTRAIKTRKDAILVEIMFQGGMKVKCTPDHLFLTVNGWISAENLKKGSLTQSFLMNGSNTLRNGSIDFMQIKDTLWEMHEIAPSLCIVQSGNQHSGPSRNYVIFIISMAMHIITALRTYYAFLEKNTFAILNLITRVLVTHVGKPQINGMHQKRVDCGIVIKHSLANPGKNQFVRRNNVNIVENNSTPLSEREDRNKNGVTPIVNQLQVESVAHLSQREDVYCIFVPSTGHFSLANGSIVKNCDALRYLCMALHKTNTGMDATEFDRQKAMALYGDHTQNLPRFFRNDPRFNRH
jgi:phage terminase large subunit